MRRTLLAVLIAAGITLGACGGASTQRASSSSPASVPVPTLAQYSQVTNGMTYAQVQSIFGRPGISTLNFNSSGAGYNYQQQKFTWGDPKGASADITFQNGTVMNKSELDLR